MDILRHGSFDSHTSPCFCTTVSDLTPRTSNFPAEVRGLRRKIRYATSSHCDIQSGEAARLRGGCGCAWNRDRRHSQLLFPATGCRRWTYVRRERAQESERI